jgi:hypothetical protein
MMLEEWLKNCDRETAMPLNWQDVAQFWPVVAGMGIVFFFAKTHFNSPDYALSGYNNLNDPDDKDAAKYSSNARLRTPAPPIFTTPRDRYRRAEWKYIGGLEGGFIILTIFPELLDHVPAAKGLMTFLGDTINGRVIPVTLLLTGFLSTFPIIREADTWLLKSLHTSASIPDDAEETATELFNSPYKADTDILARIVAQVQSQTMRDVASKKLFGSMEHRWLNIRCWGEKLTENLRDTRYKQFRRRFYDEFRDIYNAIGRLRPAVIKFANAEAAIIPSSVSNIDDWFENLAHPPAAVEKLREDRQNLMFEVDALYYRVCLFSSLMAYAVEDSDEEINRVLNDLGFEKIIVLPPRKPWDVILSASILTLAVCVLISVFYTLVVQAGWITVPSDYAPEVAKDLREAGLWAITGSVLHTLAAAVATMVTIREIRVKQRRGLNLTPENPFSRSILVAGYSSILPAGIFALYGVFDDRGWIVILWTFLPFITGFYTIGYVRATVGGSPCNGLNGPIGQAGLMSVIGFLLSIVIVAKDPQFLLWPTILWVFACYVAVIAGAIGLTMGEVFRRSLTANVYRMFASDEGSARKRLLFVAPQDQPEQSPPLVV